MSTIHDNSEKNIGSAIAGSVGPGSERLKLPPLDPPSSTPSPNLGPPRPPGAKFFSRSKKFFFLLECSRMFSKFFDDVIRKERAHPGYLVLPFNG